MKFPRRSMLRLVAGSAALAALPRAVRALDYPTRPVRIVVGYAAGGPTDITARSISQWLSDRLGQSFFVENRAGAASNLATEAVVKAEPDGYTLLLASFSNAVNATLYDNLSFNFISDISPVGGVNRNTGVLEVNPSLPVKTVAEFIAYAKANEGKINMATSGIGSGPHIYGELFNRLAGVRLVQVPYRGSGPALIDLMGGQVQVMFSDLSSSIEHIRAGKLRPLGVTTATRSEALPDVPAINEFVPGYEASSWLGVAAPKRTPVDIIEKLNSEINAALADPKFKARLSDLGGIPLPGSPSDFGKLIADETEKWGKVIRSANIKSE